MRREGSAFEDTQFSIAKQLCTETTDDLGNVNAFPRCPSVLGYRRGRTREKSDSERVRKNVSNAVTRAIEAVAVEHVRLGKHLGNSINSGSVFSYDPEKDPEWLV